MKNKVQLIAIAIISIIATITLAFLDHNTFKQGAFMGIGLIILFATLLFLFLTINYFALAFFVKRMLKYIRKQ